MDITKFMANENEKPLDNIAVYRHYIVRNKPDDFNQAGFIGKVHVMSNRVNYKRCEAH